MSLDSYFLPAVKAVPIPKKSGAEQIIGVANTVVTMALEPIRGLYPVSTDGFKTAVDFPRFTRHS